VQKRTNFVKRQSTSIQINKQVGKTQGLWSATKQSPSKARLIIQNQYYVRQKTPRATLGQRQLLIKPSTQINIQQFSGKTTPPQYKKTNKTQHTQAAALHPDGTGRRVSFRTSSGCTDPTDADAGRTNVSVDPARRNDRTPRGRSSRRRRQRPRRRSTPTRLHCRPTCAFSSTVYTQLCRLSRNFFASPLKHVLFT